MVTAVAILAVLIVAVALSNVFVAGGYAYVAQRWFDGSGVLDTSDRKANETATGI